MHTAFGGNHDHVVLTLLAMLCTAVMAGARYWYILELRSNLGSPAGTPMEVINGLGACPYGAGISVAEPSGWTEGYILR